LTPNSGSNGSTLITAIVPGVGKGTQDLDLVKNDGKTICRKDVEVVEYGKI
jgi:hypothetical protein